MIAADFPESCPANRQDRTGRAVVWRGCGWNITAGGARPFHTGQICNYTGGMIPFARTKAERKANKDPRLSLEERYGTHEGCINAVRAAAQNAVKEGSLLQADADRLIKQAMASNVLK